MQLIQTTLRWLRLNPECDVIHIELKTCIPSLSMMTRPLKLTAATNSVKFVIKREICFAVTHVRSCFTWVACGLSWIQSRKDLGVAHFVSSM